MQIGEFSLVNDEKLNRAINGSIGREGKLSGGVGEKATEGAILAEYDRLGGLILKGDNKVKTGSFYDFENKTPREEPEVVFEISIDGEITEASEDEAKAIKSIKVKTDKLKKKVKKIKK